MNEPMKEQAALYALGLLPSSEAERWRAQGATDAELKDEAAAFAAVVDELALEPLAVAPAPGLRDQLMARIAVTPQEVPAPKIAAERFDAGNWEQMAPHVFCKVLFQDPHSQLVTSLVKLEPGGYLPRHRHTGIEQTLIVTGDCIVNGETFYPGDFRFCLADTEDTEVTTEFGTTIMMIAPAQFEILDAAWAH